MVMAAEAQVTLLWLQDGFPWREGERKKVLLLFDPRWYADPGRNIVD